MDNFFTELKKQDRTFRTIFRLDKGLLLLWLMKLFWIVIVFIFVAGCTSKVLYSNQQYTNDKIPLRMELPAGSGKPKLSSFTKKEFALHATQVAGNPNQEILFYNGGNDNPDKVPYTAVGTVVAAIDTTKLKATGFANRQANNQPYLHKTAIDKTRRIVISEYVVKTPDKYFYLFASAPIIKAIRQNEEAMIIVQDSLNRKYSAAIGTIQFTK